MYKGIVGSEGIAIGNACLYFKNNFSIDRSTVPKDMIEEEVSKLVYAVEAARKQIQEIREKAYKDLCKDEAEIFDAHLMIINDPALIEEAVNIIRNESISALNAIQKVVDNYIDAFSIMESEYLKERAADIQDIGSRIIKNIMGVESDTLCTIDDKTIIIAHELLPSDTVLLNTNMVYGFATDVGGKTSHTAILARSLEIPAVLGLGNITEKVKNGDTIILDAVEGNVIVNPTANQVEFYRNKQEEYYMKKQEMKKLKSLKAITPDGREIGVSANVSKPADIDKVIENCGDGIGLYRTEFLYMNRDKLPSEDEQFLAYKSAAAMLRGKPVIIRTLDIGGDKKLPYLNLPEEMNPFLGWRAIRICLKRREMFKTQLRAILRASVFGNILIMYPMISDISELREANKVLEEVKNELESDNIDYNKNIKVGIMMEVPSAALTSDILVKEADFFSIGTNDLCQYTLAVDRMNERVSYLYKPFHPSVLRLIKKIILDSHVYGKFTSLCGEMASDPIAAVILLGLGLDEFSMSPSSIPTVKKAIRNITYEKAKEISEYVLTLSTAEEIIEYMKPLLKEMQIEVI